MTLFTFWQACEKAADAVRASNAQTVSPACEFLRPTDLITMVILLAVIIYVARVVHREIVGSADAHSKSYEKIRVTIDREIERAYELESAARFGSLSQGLFHDLISPLTTISLSIESLKSNGAVPSPDLDKIINRTVAASQRMQRLMDGIRKTMSGTSGSKEKLAKIKTSIYEEAVTVKDLLSYKARMAAVEIVIDIDRKLQIMARPLAIHQVFMNLIANAIEAYGAEIQAPDIYMPDKQGAKRTVEVSARILNKNILLEVTDHGCGIDSEKADKIYEKSYSTKGSARGIGLWAVKSIVQKDLHGNISEKSTPGKGTAFTILIPLKAS